MMGCRETLCVTGWLVPHSIRLLFMTRDVRVKQDRCHGITPNRWSLDLIIAVADSFVSGLDVKSCSSQVHVNRPVDF